MAAMVDDDLIRIIAQALADAREKGLDDVDRTGHAVRAVLAARPDMIASAALQAVNRWRRELERPSEGAQGLTGARRRLGGGGESALGGSATP